MVTPLPSTRVAGLASGLRSPPATVASARLSSLMVATEAVPAIRPPVPAVASAVLVAAPTADSRTAVPAFVWPSAPVTAR